jgi:hypothetical protein
MHLLASEAPKSFETVSNLSTALVQNTQASFLEPEEVWAEAMLASFR